MSGFAGPVRRFIWAVRRCSTQGPIADPGCVAPLLHKPCCGVRFAGDCMPCSAPLCLPFVRGEYGAAVRKPAEEYASKDCAAGIAESGVKEDGRPSRASDDGFISFVSLRTGSSSCDGAATVVCDSAVTVVCVGTATPGCDRQVASSGDDVTWGCDVDVTWGWGGDVPSRPA